MMPGGGRGAVTFHMTPHAHFGYTAAVASKRKKKKRRGGTSGSSKTGGISGMRSGIKSMVGQGPKKKESLASKILTWVLLAAAVALLIYRFLL